MDAGHDVRLVVTQPDRRRGRGSSLSPSPVKNAAMEMGLDVSTELSSALEPDFELGVVVAYGALITRQLLDKALFVNLHFSLLPRWRGAAPVERAILAGDSETGVCLMALEEGLDTGPIFGTRRVDIGSAETAIELKHRLASLGSEMLVDALQNGVSGLGRPIPQIGNPTWAAKITPEELRIDWTRPASEIDRLVKVGRAWTTFSGERLVVARAALPPLAHTSQQSSTSSGTNDAGVPILDVSGDLGPGALIPKGNWVICGDGVLKLVEVQPENKKRMAAKDWLNGMHKKISLMEPINLGSS